MIGNNLKASQVIFLFLFRVLNRRVSSEQNGKKSKDQHTYNTWIILPHIECEQLLDSVLSLLMIKGLGCRRVTHQSFV